MRVASVTAADLRAVDLFDELDDDQLALWAAAAEPFDGEAGQILSEAGQHPIGLWLLLEGEVMTMRMDEGRVDLVGRHRAPTWIGAVPALIGNPLVVRMQAETACRLAIVPRERFMDLALSQRAVHQRIMRMVGPLMTRLSAGEQQRDRLASLGTMAAGLAHELNNPAAAAKRAAGDLADALEAVGSTIATFVESGMEREGAEQMVRLQRAALARAESRTAAGALDAADAEDAMLDRLEALGVPEAWRLAEPLAAAGLDDAWLDDVARYAGPATEAALRWVAASLTARSLAAELKESTERMSSLVGAVKSYAYMGRGEVVDADVHEGLDTTLVVLGHKLKHTSIDVVRDYDRTLPTLTVYGSELNQVWTNLLDNAIDALGDSGTLTISTRRDGPCIRVDIADDGPGIPEEMRAHVFEPFFTTKDVGSGTGLGLDTARRIVEERHTGTLKFETGPGGTVFHTWLPLRDTTR
jgi:signal transduction histidine kinase